MKRLLLLAAISGLLAPTSTQAAPLVFTGTSGNLSAAVSFDNVGGNLVVTLANVGADVMVPADILTAVFFDLAGVGALTPVSALLAGASTVHFDADGQPAGGDLGGEWAYESGLAAPGGATKGISSSGFGLFGGSNFGGVDLDGPAALGGFNYGLLSQVDNQTTGNPQVTIGSAVPLIQSAVVFTLSGLPLGFDPSVPGNITNVSFQYGTALTEPSVPGSGDFPDVPEPAVLSLLAVGLGVGASRLRR
jgi:hypothetical protein